jgi:uncharacterized protein (DUF885 family)
VKAFACVAIVMAIASMAMAPEANGFTQLVDEYLEQFARRHPSIAAGNGLHGHDDTLEDFSAAAVASEVAWLRAFRARVEAIDSSTLSSDERVDRRILLGVIDGWLLDLDKVRNWTRNPMIYASAISDGVHNLMTMEYAPAEERMAKAAAKLEAVPRLIATATVNIRTPPRPFVERGIVMFRGILDLLSNDLPLAFQGVGAPALRDRLQLAATTARSAVEAYANTLERNVLPNAGDTYAIGMANVEARYRAEELIDLPADRLLAVGERELAKNEAEFVATAQRLDPSTPPLEVWQRVLDDHPKRGELVAAAQKTVDQLFEFIKAKRLIDVPPGERVVVAAAPEFDLGLASMHSSPPMEPRPVKSFYYVTDARADWPIERQNAWLQKFNYATLADISAHEVAPGHYVHSLFMRRTPGKIRRIWIGLNPFPQPSSGQDGWAHYAEQLVIDEGFMRNDPRYKLAQISEALTRICRMIAGLRLHSGAFTIDQAAAFFERSAHLPAPAARQEAVRGTYDPTYGGYFLGKMAVLKLRRDYAAARGPRFDLREFHERVMTHGIAPWWAHRQLLLPGDTSPVVE